MSDFIARSFADEHFQSEFHNLIIRLRWCIVKSVGSINDIEVLDSDLDALSTRLWLIMP